MICTGSTGMLLQYYANKLTTLQLHELDFETYNWTLPPVHGTPPAPR